ncbi:hypothetical protein, partial [Escherichia coli]|uniref:hypothetical protein n=1 Tax=Escherichia coli TaxID=562 RepID=UPI003F474B94
KQKPFIQFPELSQISPQAVASPTYLKKGRKSSSGIKAFQTSLAEEYSRPICHQSSVSMPHKEHIEEQLSTIL